MGHIEQTQERRAWQSEIPEGAVPVEGTESVLKIFDVLVHVPIQQFARDLRIVEPGILALGKASVIRVLDDPGPLVFFDPSSGKSDHFDGTVALSPALVFNQTDDPGVDEYELPPFRVDDTVSRGAQAGVYSEKTHALIRSLR